MLKLTQFDTKTAVYVSAQALLPGAIWQLEHIGSGILVGGKEFWVSETPEEIFAMPEMKAALDATNWTSAVLAGYPNIASANTESWTPLHTWTPNRR